MCADTCVYTIMVEKATLLKIKSKNDSQNLKRCVYGKPCGCEKYYVGKISKCFSEDQKKENLNNKRFMNSPG